MEELQDESEEQSIKKVVSPRIFSSIVKVADVNIQERKSHFMIIGGRAHPDQPFGDLFHIAFDHHSRKVSARKIEQTIEPRYRHSAVFVKEFSKIVVFGGKSRGSKTTNDLSLIDCLSPWNVESLNDIGAKLSLLHSGGKLEDLHDDIEGPEARHSHSMVAMDDGSGRLLLFGGCLASGQALHDFWLLDLQQRLWRKIQLYSDRNHSEHPSARFSHSSWLIGGYLFILGGCCPSVLNDCWKFDFQKAVWSQLTLKVSIQELVDSPDSRKPEEEAVSYSRSVEEGRLMLCRHTSTVLADEGAIVHIGGGALCFSFGNFFNPCMITRHSPEILL